ncbi:hypothetical protein BY458DRAFT_575097 [Sporodiniella umbellata]|nr:hypothetical protein BY458DRAFT_575097 [Sporodiniella umbellata]
MSPEGAEQLKIALGSNRLDKPCFRCQMHLSSIKKNTHPNGLNDEDIIGFEMTMSIQAEGLAKKSVLGIDLLHRLSFWSSDLIELKHTCISLPNILEEVKAYLNKYNKDWKLGKELYKYLDVQKHDQITQFNCEWIRKGIMRASEIFFHEDTVDPDDLSEPDLLHKLWPFV